MKHESLFEFYLGLFIVFLPCILLVNTQYILAAILYVPFFYAYFRLPIFIFYRKGMKIFSISIALIHAISLIISAFIMVFPGYRDEFIVLWLVFFFSAGLPVAIKMDRQRKLSG